tara:strand:+ start:440 stop:1471 length:1032 start_codon:yes stop_codon:yes gene_type:complete
MLGNYSYHEIFRKTIVAFGTMFNNIEIRRQDEVMKVPLAYGPKQKFLARLDQNPDPTNKRVQITLPRLSFEIAGVSYDPGRKVSPTQKIKFKKDVNENKNAFMPVPYNINFELAIISKNQDDGLQIIEQILPYFQPHYNLSVKLATTIGETKDVPIVLQDINYEDDYEGDFTNRRAIIYTLQFTAKTYLYGPVTDSKTIKKAITDYYTSTDTTKAPREKRYTVTPTALTDQDGVGLTTLTAAMDVNDGIISVASVSSLEQGVDIQIGTEVMHINRVVGSTLHVSRGWNNTTIAGHQNGAAIMKIDEDDAALLESDDDFGFGELYSDFTDMKKRNPVSGQDETI